MHTMSQIASIRRTKCWICLLLAPLLLPLVLQPLQRQQLGVSAAATNANVRQQQRRAAAFFGGSQRKQQQSSGALPMMMRWNHLRCGATTAPLPPSINSNCKQEEVGSPTSSFSNNLVLAESSRSSSSSSASTSPPSNLAISESSTSYNTSNAAAAISTPNEHNNSASILQVLSPLRVVYAVSFLLSLSISLVALAPVQWMSQSAAAAAAAAASSSSLSSSATTTLLSAVTAGAALLEITASSALGAQLDRSGRKPVLAGTVLAMVAAHAVTAFRATAVTVCASKFVDLVAIGFFALTVQTILSDIVLGTATTTTTTSSSSMANDDDAAISGNNSNSNNNNNNNSQRVSAAMGVQMALSGVGFLLGMLGAGQLIGSAEHGLATVYGGSALAGALALLLVQWGLPETLQQRQPSQFGQPAGAAAVTASSSPMNSSGNSKNRLLQSLVSCTGLLTRHGKDVRVLGVLLMLMTFPMFMGDIFLVFAKSEWQLTAKQLSSFFALFGGIGILSNAAGSVLVKRIGIRRFTSIAIVSKMLTAIGTAFFGYRGSVLGLLLGFLGSAQSIGIVAALVAAGTETGLPQGILAGERASLMALLKVLGPIVYSTLLVQGETWLGTNKLPFYFNIALSVVALMISLVHLHG